MNTAVPSRPMQRRRFLAGTASTTLALAGALWSPRALAGGRATAQYFDKMARFDADYSTDVVLPVDGLATLESVLGRLRRVQAIVGHGNFHTLGFDRMLKVARDYSRVGRFPPHELAFIERLFYADPRRYGFYGEKVMPELTSDVRKKATVGSRGSGQRLYRGKAVARYERMHRAIGDDLVLTSGVRGIVKQSYLFLRKAAKSHGNLSRASRSLAPPGYSFHAIGDFDIGKRGLGGANFTGAFAHTDVYRRLAALGFVDERYPARNRLGVRYEPWHVKVV